jgi:hypothetical protein
MEEGRPMTKENPEKPTETGTQSLGETMSGLDRIRKAAHAFASAIRGRRRMR